MILGYGLLTYKWDLICTVQVFLLCRRVIKRLKTSFYLADLVELNERIIYSYLFQEIC